MRKIRRHKDITTRWRVKTNGAATALAGRDLSLFLVDPVGNHSAMDFSITDTNLITFVWYGKEQDILGAYTLTLVENIRKVGETAVDAVDYVELVATTAQETPATSSDLLEVSAVNLSGDLTTNGRGASAYEVWLANGHTGTVEDYFDYLKKPATDEAASVEARVGVLETAAGVATASATSAASSAQSAATTANNAASAANSAAESATGIAQSIASAELSRVSAESARASAEAARKTAEDAREDAEDDRVDAEIVRAQHEVQRVANETARASAETARATASASAVSAANSAANSANTAASSATSAATSASTQAAYAKEQGDYAKAQGAAARADLTALDSKIGELEKTVNGQEAKTETWTATGTQSGYHAALFGSIIPKGTTITKITVAYGVFGYFLKTDGNFDTSTATNAAVPFVTQYDYKGLQINNIGTCTIKSETAASSGLIGDVADLKTAVGNVNAILETI